MLQTAVQVKIHLQQPRKKKRNTRKTRQKTHIHVASASCRSEIQRKCCGENKPSSGFGQSHNSLFLGNATHTHRNNIIGHLNHSTYLLFDFILFLLRLKKKRQPLVIASHRIASHYVAAPRTANLSLPYRHLVSANRRHVRHCLQRLAARSAQERPRRIGRGCRPPEVSFMILCL